MNWTTFHLYRSTISNTGEETVLLKEPGTTGLSSPIISFSYCDNKAFAYCRENITIDHLQNMCKLVYYYNNIMIKGERVECRSGLK